MIGTKTKYEDYAGADTDYDERYICNECENEIEAGEQYAEKWNNKIICADCLENIKKVDELLDILGYFSVIELVDALKAKKLHYV